MQLHCRLMETQQWMQTESNLRLEVMNLQNMVIFFKNVTLKKRPSLSN